MQFSDNRLYSCGTEGGSVAGRVRWDELSRVIHWFNPGGRHRAYEVAEVLQDTDDRFAFVDRQGRLFELQPLTPALYNDRVRGAREPRLETEAELLEAYERSQRLGG